MVSTCVRVNNEWLTVPVEACSRGEYCNLKEKGCSSNTGPCNPVGHTGNFVCTSLGIFPNPYDCQRYHVCYQSGINLVSLGFACMHETAFSPTTGECSLTVEDGVCNEPQFKCENSGDKGSWPGNDNIFYICKAVEVNNQRVLFPTLYRCGSNEVFTGQLCERKPLTISTPAETFTMSTSTSPLSSSTQNPIDTTTSPGGNFICYRAGIYPDRTNCRYYFSCDTYLRPIRIQCPIGTYFNQEMSSCYRGEC